ncbi:MAG: tetratricopeptide repeat protein [Oceanospirillaceae bacterium]|nr:tetratricopeptide repeat protein [Oceanospirillaceae bacterium]
MSIKLNTMIPFALSALLACTLLQGAGNWQVHQDKAMSLYQAGLNLKAERQVRQALSIAKKAGNGAKFTASSLNLLAFIQSSNGDFAKSINSIQQAIILSKKHYGKRHSQVAVLLFNKGGFLEQLNKESLAFTAYSDAWEIQRIDNNLVVEDSLKTISAWVRLSNQKQQYSASIKQAASFLEAQQQLKTAKFSEGLRLLSYALAHAYLAQQQPVMAQQILNRELNVERKLLSKNDLRIAATLERLANTHDIDDSGEKAVSLREQALNIRANSNQVTLINAMNLNEVALLSQTKKDYRKAQQLYQKALQTLSELQRDKGIEQALILANFASLQAAKGDEQQALILYKKSIQLHKVLNAKPVQAAFTAARAGSIYYGRHQYKQTEALFLQSLHWIEGADQSAADNDFHKVALDNLVALYAAWHKNSKRAIYLKKLKSLGK